MRRFAIVCFYYLICFALLSSDRSWVMADEKPKAKQTRFYLATLEGENPQIFFVTDDYYNIGSPSFSAEGQKLAFDGWKTQEGEAFSKVQIMTVNSDGSEFKVLGSGAMPSWSPGGNRIAFTQPYPPGVAIMNADGSNRKLIDTAGWGARWSPDGKKITYRVNKSGKSNLRIYDLIEDTKSDVFPEGESPYSLIYWNMAWSPDSNWVCFKGRKSSDRTYDVATVNVAGMKEGYKVHYNNKQAPYANFAWHPQGDMIVFCPALKPRQFFKFNPAEDKAPEPLALKVKGFINGDVSFTPDGQQLLFNMRNEN